MREKEVRAVLMFTSPKRKECEDGHGDVLIIESDEREGDVRLYSGRAK